MIFHDVLPDDKVSAKLTESFMGERPVLFDITGLGKHFLFPLDKGVFVPYDQVFGAWVGSASVYGRQERLSDKIKGYFHVYEYSEEIRAMIERMDAQEFAIEDATKVFLLV